MQGNWQSPYTYAYERHTIGVLTWEPGYSLHWKVFLVS